MKFLLRLIIVAWFVLMYAIGWVLGAHAATTAPKQYAQALCLAVRAAEPTEYQKTEKVLRCSVGPRHCDGTVNLQGKCPQGNAIQLYYVFVRLTHGSKTQLVRVAVYPDGSPESYKVLWTRTTPAA
jgi:hypothetical protein